MYMAVALVYIVVAGQPIGEPSSYNSRVTFMKLAECQAYLKSEQFVVDREVLHHKVVEEMTAEEFSQSPGVAITASCEEDRRL